jgi:hypothetical protein
MKIQIIHSDYQIKNGQNEKGKIRKVFCCKVLVPAIHAQ